MANYQQLIYNISNYIKENHSNDITGSVLQNILLSIVSSVGGYKYMGVASTSGHPETPDYNIFYVAYSQNGGTYPYYGNITLNANELAILKYNGSWSKDSIGTISGGGSSINVVDNLTTDSGTDALSARQGMLLNNGIELINALIEQGSFLEIAQVKGNSTLQLNDFIPNSEGTLEIPIATVNGLGLVRPDGTTITVNNGVLTVIGGGSDIDVINDLNSTSTTDALSANMGRSLNQSMQSLEPKTAYTEHPDTVTTYTSNPAVTNSEIHVFKGALTSLVIGQDSTFPMYERTFLFRSGTTPTTISLNNHVKVGDWDIEANTSYVLSCKYGVAVIAKAQTS